MLSADPLASTASVPAPLALPASVHGWGGCQAVSVELLEPERIGELTAAVAACRASSQRAIPRGMGRSYGDAAQLDGGLVLQSTKLKGYELDREQGVVTAQAGATVGELLAGLVPAGWMVPVVPGTQHVTIGGAIASDIHGKNHGAVGSFGQHVDRLALLRSQGEIIEVEPGQPDGLFEATVGGMGLTGVILWARVRLKPISSGHMSVDTDRVADLDHALAALGTPGGSYRVAWLDLLGSPLGRGVVTRAEHLPASAAPPARTPNGNRALVSSMATIPARWPEWPLRPATVRAFNEFRFRRSPRRQRDHAESIGSHLFPLDVLEAWPRLYGRGGFLQYQLVVPYGGEDVLVRVIEGLRRARLPCYLAILKDFGSAAGPPLSFPVPGWTLTLDIPRLAPGLDAALDRFDEWVAGAGGRVYLSKDVRMRAPAMEAMYPRLDEWREMRERADPDHLWRSDLALRTGLVPVDS